MTDLRRVPVVSPKGKRLVLVIDGTYMTGMEDGFLREEIPLDAIVAVEECPDDVAPTIAMGWDPRTGLPG